MKLRFNAYALERTTAGKLVPRKANLEGADKLSIRGRDGTVIVSEERCVGQFKGKPAWLIPHGKGEALPVKAEDTKSLVSAEIANELNENQYARQVMQALLDAAHQTKKSDWLIIGFLVLNVLVTLWAMNEIKDVVSETLRWLSTVHPMPTTGPGAGG